MAGRQWETAETLLNALQESEAEYAWHPFTPGAASPALKASFLFKTGRARQAVATLRQQQRLDPLSPAIARDMSYYLQATGQWEESEKQALKALELGLPQNTYDLLETGRLTDRRDLPALAGRLSAMPELRMGFTTEEMESYRLLESALASGNIQQSVLRLQEWSNSSKLPVFFLELYFLLSIQLVPELMLDMIRVGAEGELDLIEYIWRHSFALIRMLPGFNALLEDLGLMNYWRATGQWPDFCEPGTGAISLECA